MNLPATAELVPVTIIPKITSKVEAVSPSTVALVLSKVAVLTHIRIIDGTSLAAADDAFSSVRKLRAEIEKQRKATKAPALELCDLIDDAARPVLAFLDQAIATAQVKIDLWNREQRRKHEEEQRRLQAEAEAAEREEQARREAEAKRLRDEATAAAAKAAADAAELNDMLGAEEPVIEPARVVAPPPQPLQAERVIVKAAAAPAPELSKTVTSRTRQVAEIFNADLVPHAIAGEILRDYRMTVIQHLLERGVAVPGCRLAMVTAPASRAS